MVKHAQQIEALTVARKLQLGGFVSDAAALRSLQRRTGVGGDAAVRLLRDARSLLDAAIAAMAENATALYALREAQGGVGPKDVVRFRPALPDRYRKWSRGARDSALWTGAIYQML